MNYLEIEPLPEIDVMTAVENAQFPGEEIKELFYKALPEVKKMFSLPAVQSVNTSKGNRGL